ncbi:uncharacterized protein [Cherax quadricarinatus]
MTCLILTLTLITTYLIQAQVQGQSRGQNSLGLQHEDMDDGDFQDPRRHGNGFSRGFERDVFDRRDFDSPGFRNPGFDNRNFDSPGVRKPGFDNHDFDGPGFDDFELEGPGLNSPEARLPPDERTDKGVNTMLNVDHLNVPPGNLTCYSCKLDFRKAVYQWNHPCLGRHHGMNVSADYLVACGPNDIFCRVERTEVNGVLITLTRECTDVCYFGCRPKGFGISYESCAKCCTIHACNDMYPLSRASTDTWPSAFTLLAWCLVIFSRQKVSV